MVSIQLINLGEILDLDMHVICKLISAFFFSFFLLLQLINLNALIMLHDFFGLMVWSDCVQKAVFAQMDGLE